MIAELVKKTRSYRRFYEEKEITVEQLTEFVNLARLTASGANKQPLRYKLVADRETNAKVFDLVGWAGYLTEWPGPVAGERPSAYIAICGPQGNSAHDEGIVAQTIMLAASEVGIGGCMMGNIDRVKLAEVLNLPEEYQVKLILALGYPKEEVVIDEINAGDDIKYFRDENQVHHVPKIKLEDVLL